MPGTRSLPNIAITPMAIRKRKTILTITSQAKARVGGTLLDLGEGLVGHLGAEAA